MQLEQFNYDNKIVRNFGIATIIWGIVGMTIGLLVATQLVWPQMNFGLQFTTFGRVRPVHTNAVIFAFVGNGIFMGVLGFMGLMGKLTITAIQMASLPSQGSWRGPSS